MTGRQKNRAGNPQGMKSHKAGCSCGWCRRIGNRSNLGRHPIHRADCQCPWHRSLAGAENPAWRGGRTGYSLVGWKAARYAVWERDKVCQVCGKPPKPGRRLDVHHVVARRDGGTDDLSNLVGLHHGCHQKIHYGKATIWRGIPAANRVSGKPQ